ncbi:hypothetical protein NUW54_g9633 [Trametes sanguinea]|uniref:Uncharacterized protein n=1 Tax=Trametes sanguinea TaxID=158606 RepID=A0ACC1P4I4_9APHY|nr:hypothetical protein NUW54_g9633 [Trametes sanguinea]
MVCTGRSSRNAGPSGPGRYTQLLTRSGNTAEEALFPDVRRALGLIRNLPIFALFLSTVGKLEQFSPPPQLDSSERIFRSTLVPFPPIVWTPVDVLAARITNDKVWTLREVASTHHIAHLGRPLFAAMYDAALAEGDQEVHTWIVKFALQKLLKALDPETLSLQQALACIAVRIPIEFNPAPLTPPDGNDADVERNLVADHMRLLLAVARRGAGVRMISSRWSDGAMNSVLHHQGWNPLLATMHYLGTSLLDLGERGEIATAFLLLYARDRATTFPHQPPYPGSSSDDHGLDPMYDGASKRRIVTVNQFLEALLGKERFGACAASVPRAYHTLESAAIPLATAFRDGHIYFNHFIKVNSYEMVNQQYLHLAISRGAAIICANGQTGIDIVVPILIGTSCTRTR